MTMRKTARFAAKTRVPIDKTRLDIERLVKKYAAKGFAAGWQGNVARIKFLCADRHIRAQHAGRAGAGAGEGKMSHGFSRINTDYEAKQDAECPASPAA